MAKFSLSPTFIKEVFQLFRQKSLKEIFFGKKVELNKKERDLLTWIKSNPDEFKKLGGRKGTFIKIGIAHKGQGVVYLLPNKLGNMKAESVLLFDVDVKIQPGPDLYVYLSTKKGKELGEILDLGLLRGTKGGQSYIINKSITQLQRYQSVAIYCKKFEVMFTFALLE